MTLFGSEANVMKDMKGYLEVEQVNKIIEQTNNQRDRLLIILLANTGRRISEALQLKPKDIDYNNEVIYWRILKRRKDTFKWIATKRSLLIAIKTFTKVYRIKEDDYVFKSSHNPLTHLTRFRAHQIIRRLGERAGITKIGESKMHPHILRHSFAVWSARLIKNAGDLRILQELLGHSKIETTAYYLQFSQKDIKSLINDLPDFINLGLSQQEIDKELKKPNDFLFTNASKGLNNDL